MGYAAEHPVLRKARLLAQDRPNLQQFGQPYSGSTWNGSTACTHVVLQFLTLLWLGKYLTIDQVSAKAGYYRERSSSGAIRGMSNTEFARFCSSMGLPYVIRFGLSFDTMHSYTTRGPVFLGVRHGSIPEKKGYVYFGTRADGSPNGFARQNGRTQLTGFEQGRHAVLDLGSRKYMAETSTATVSCSTILRRSASIRAAKVGSVAKGDKLTVSDVVDGSSWSGCNTRGSTWYVVRAVNGRSVRTLYGRAAVYIAAGLASSTFGIVREDLWSKDPNHGSGSRPEKPPYDIILRSQAKTMYNHFSSRLGSSLYGAIPTRQLPT